MQIKVRVDITHPYRGDLRVTLIAPSGSSVVLHNRQGGRADNLKRTYDVTSTPQLSNLIGQSITGDWTLHVQDLAPRDRGRLKGWGFEIRGLQMPITHLEESPGRRIPDDRPAGIVQELPTTHVGRIKDITASVDITHTYIGDLIVTLISPRGTRVHLHHRSGGNADNIIKTYTMATTPGLGVLVGERVRGTSKLKVADLEAADLGKLNHWELRITRQS
jgi:subtilisin-like proprotein convertase family protein